MKETESKKCGYGQKARRRDTGIVFLRLQEVAGRLVTAGNEWLRFMNGDESGVTPPMPFDEGLYWRAKAALDDVDQLYDRERELRDKEGKIAGENPDPPPAHRRPVPPPPPPPPNETTTRGAPLPPKSPSQQKADESRVSLEKADRALSQAYEVVAATERIVEVARRAAEKAKVAHQAAGDAVGVGQRDHYWGEGRRLFGVASEAVGAARVGRAQVLVALAVAMGTVSGEWSTGSLDTP